MSDAKAVHKLFELVERLNRHADDQHLRLRVEGQAARESADPGRSAAHWRAAAMAAMESNVSRGVAATLAQQAQEMQKQAA